MIWMSNARPFIWGKAARIIGAPKIKWSAISVAVAANVDMQSARRWKKMTLRLRNFIINAMTGIYLI